MNHPRPTAPSASPETPARAVSSRSWDHLVLPLVFVVLVLGFFSIESKVLSQTNVQNVLTQVSILAVVTIGASVVIFSGGFDLSAGAVVAWILARRRKGTHTTPTGVTTRAGADGFRVRAPNAPAGSRVRYACIVNGVEVSDFVPLEGAEETFVYTGAAPSAIRVIELVVAPTDRYRGSNRILPPSTPPPRQPSSEPPRERDSARAVVVPLATPPPSDDSHDSSFLGSPRAY